MEALDTTLYEEGTQVPLNPSTTSGQVRHKDTTVEKALENDDLRITDLRKIVIWNDDDQDTIRKKVDMFLATDSDSTVLYLNPGNKNYPQEYVPLTAYREDEGRGKYRFTGYFPKVETRRGDFVPERWERVTLYVDNEGDWAWIYPQGQFLTSEAQSLSKGDQLQARKNIDAGTKAIRINYGNAEAAASAIAQYNADPQKTVILVNYNGIRCVATVSFTASPFLVAYVPEGLNLRKLLFSNGAWSETIIYGDTVRYNKQTLTNAQQAQARKNINALGDAAGVITTDKIADNAVTKEKIKDQALPGSKLYNKAITNDQLDNNCVRAYNIVDGAVTGDKIYDDAITTPKIKDGAVTIDKLAEQTINTPKILDNAVTTDKLAQLIITEDTTTISEYWWNELAKMGKKTDGKYTFNKVPSVFFKSSSGIPQVFPLQSVKFIQRTNEALLELDFSGVSLDPGAPDVYDNNICGAIVVFTFNRSGINMSSYVGLDITFDEFLNNGSDYLNGKVLTDSSVSKEKLQQWVIKWDDTEIDAAIWDELTAFDQLPDKIPNIVFMDKYFQVYSLFRAEMQTDEIKRLTFSQLYSDVEELTGENTFVSVSQVDINKPVNGKCAISVKTSETEITNVIANYVQTLISISDIDGTKLKDATVTPSKLAPSVMQHLEAVVINSFEKEQTLAALYAYSENLQKLGVDTNNPPIIPVYYDGSHFGFVQYSAADQVWAGLLANGMGASEAYILTIDTEGNCVITQLSTIDDAKLKADKSTLATSLQAITIYTDNTAEHNAANLANIKAYEDNLKAMGVDTTKQYILPVITPDKGRIILQGNASQGFFGYGWDNDDFTNRGCMMISNLDGQYNYASISSYEEVVAEIDSRIGGIDTILDNIIG